MRMKIIFTVLFTVYFFFQHGQCTPTRTLDDVLTKLSLISSEHEHIMSVLLELTDNLKDTEEKQNKKSDKLTREIIDTLKYVKEKLGLPGTSEMLEGSGASYVRWGRTECPAVNGTVKVYDGFAAGDYFEHIGGPSELLCLPKEPSWGKYDDNTLGYAFVYGVEYEPGSFDQSQRIFEKNINQKNVPCVVCQSIGRIVALRVPGRTDCYNGWTKEYSGYLMGGHWKHKKSTDYTCVDAEPEFIAGSARDQNGHLLYFVEASCHENSLPCPPYVNGREIACVICTK